MSTDAKSLLDIMSLRLALYDEGTIRSAKFVADATKVLVHRLSTLEPVEDIEISILNENPLHVQYIRSSTGEVLAEIDEAANV